MDGDGNHRVPGNRAGANWRQRPGGGGQAGGGGRGGRRGRGGGAGGGGFGNRPAQGQQLYPQLQRREAVGVGAVVDGIGGGAVGDGLGNRPAHRQHRDQNEERHNNQRNDGGGRGGRRGGEGGRGGRRGSEGGGGGGGLGNQPAHEQHFNQQQQRGEMDGRDKQNRNQNNNRYRNPRGIGFRDLEILAQSDVEDVITKVNDKRDAFLDLMNTLDPTDESNHNMFVLIMEILSKVSQSSFQQLKTILLLKVCDSQFIGLLGLYLMNLPSVSRKTRNRLYWDKQDTFWTNFSNFCEGVINTSPATALLKCRSLIEVMSKCCIEELVKRHSLVLQEDINLKLTRLRERLCSCEEQEQVTKRRHHESGENEEPPEDFRQLSVVPSRDDLLENRPFLRRNIVQGAYRDVEHYLDVQFRLLREDCFGPLREGINQFIADPKRKKFDNIKVYHNVTFWKPYISKTKIGSVIKLDEKTVKRFAKTNWAHSKRFIFGSLLLLTKDNCRTFISATILDRDEKLLKQGKVPISIVGLALNDNLYNEDKYVMIESEVYFEPYFHVLKALQDQTFPENLAMSKYIVNVDPEPKPPVYINNDSIIKVDTENAGKIEFFALHENSWPSADELGLNRSQYEAYKLALTHEFAVIQGPPGTGKTYLGVKIAKTLLENLTQTNNSCLMLIICYTNHALDQFLEAILPLTQSIARKNHALDQFLEAILPLKQSIARVGGQSRNKAMEKINLTTLRLETAKKSRDTNRLFYDQLHNLKDAVRELQGAQQRLERLQDGVLGYDILKELVPGDVSKLGEYYRTHRRNVKGDPLIHWLFENTEYKDVDLKTVAEEMGGPDPTQQQEQVAVDADDLFSRTEALLDDFDDCIEIDLDEQIIPSFSRINPSFSVEQTENELKNLLLVYQKLGNDNRHRQQQLYLEIRYLKSRLDLFSEMAALKKRQIQLQITNETDFSLIPLADRWALYFQWAAVVLNRIRTNIQPLQRKVKEANDAYEEARMVMDYQVLKGMKVIGMTTSGAARLRKLLLALAPRIVIIEEAAEVLEQHIVTSLTKHCQHLILIGDHQQLRPSAAYMRLARHYNMEVSLFERMINNGIHSKRLLVQHRMRPSFSALICPHIYPDLENHPSVHHFPPVRGITDNLFFMSHNFMEEQVDDSASRTNMVEGDMVLGLANYLMQQGYQPEDVTILAAYSGQMFYLRKQRPLYLHLAKVKITVLDNYQGEESKIILLSLVRNNNDGKIGFLATENRVCVALSRAREGMYIFGNIDILKNNSEIWKKISKTLEDNASIGSQLILKCEMHADQISTISSPKEFSNKVPEGGCLLKCNFNLPCGHLCPLVCHGYDRGHVTTKCNLKCERVLCELGHVCPLICHVTCQPCKRLVTKELPCGHSKLVYCHLEPNDPSIRCLTMVTVTLPHCQHEVKKPCHVDIKAFICPVPCNYRVKCGHTCRLKCHVKDDPDHEKYLCAKPCAKAKKGCTQEDNGGDRGDHQCQRQCHQECDNCTVEVVKKRTKCKHSDRLPCNFNVDEVPCRKNCARLLDCGHHCKKKCFEKCGDCKQKVTKTITDCQHQIDVMCMEAVTREMCQKPCEHIMVCGHRCRDICGRPCDQTKCTEIVQKHFSSPCGHNVMLPCNVFSKCSGRPDNDILLEYCRAPCGALLDCTHACGGDCGRCRQGRLHAPCDRPCSVTTLCGHKCKEPCKQLCPPCNMPCEVKCVHSKCNQLCGKPCFPCQEPCERRCPHGACSKRCGEACSRAPCDERCDAALPCGHACRGLCGEPCPRYCQLCSPEQFPKSILGDDLEPDERIVQLQDCPHAFEVEFLDGLVKTKHDEVKIPDCPLCRKPIINTYRYKDIINKMLKEEVDPIKLRVYGNEEQIKKEKKNLETQLGDFQKKYVTILTENSSINNALQRVLKLVKNQKKASLLNLKMELLYLNILDMIAEKCQKHKQARATALQEELTKLVQILCSVLSTNVHKISQQLQTDMMNEIKRLNSVVQLAQIFSNPSYIASKDLPKVKTAADSARCVVLSWRVFQEEEAVAALESLQGAIKVFGIVSKEERMMVVKAVGLRQGHWYKCPNGHFYCIADCGGAVMQGQCPECHAVIGGISYRLAAGNTHADNLY